MARDAAAWLEENQLLCRTVTIKVRYSDFTTITRSHSQDAGDARRRRHRAARRQAARPHRRRDPPGPPARRQRAQPRGSRRRRSSPKSRCCRSNCAGYECALTGVQRHQSDGDDRHHGRRRRGLLVPPWRLRRSHRARARSPSCLRRHESAAPKISVQPRERAGRGVAGAEQRRLRIGKDRGASRSAAAHSSNSAAGLRRRGRRTRCA